MSTMTRPEQDLQRLLAEEPFVRELARQLVVQDADEVVQQTWLQALAHGGRDVAQPRHWLARLARNAAANLRRGDRRRAERERRAAAHELVPSSAELAEREERRRALVAAVDALPQQLRTVVILRWFEGLPPRRIARDLGVPAATVSTQLQRALDLLRQRLDEAHGGDRRAWVLPLVPFAAQPLPAPHVPSSPLLVGGTTAMTTKKLSAAVALALVALATALLWPRADAAAPPAERNAVPLAQADVRTAAASPATDEPTPSVAREALDAPAGTAAATTGTVFAHVTFADHTPAVGRVATLLRSGGDWRCDGVRRNVDDAGTACFEHVSPGKYTVVGRSIEVAAGQTVEVAYEYKLGLALSGVVLDRTRRPVAGAAIEVAEMGRINAWPEVLATSGADGRFAVCAAPDLCVVGARAPGHTASTVRFVHGKDGNSADIELMLGDGGGSVAGTVVDAEGRPVCAAAVVVGNGELAGVFGRDQIPPFAALARTDAAGRFVATGIPVGEQPVRVRASGLAAWRGSIAIPAGGTATIAVVLSPGATLHGSVSDAAGAMVASASVSIGDGGIELRDFQTRTDGNGAFELRGLPTGQLPLRVWHREAGLAEPTVNVAAGEAATCAVQLSRGLVVGVRVVDDDGQPVPDVLVECNRGANRQAWAMRPTTDAQGRTSLLNCPSTGTVTITARRSGFDDLRQDGIEGHAGEVELRMHRAAPRARIVGRVVGPDGAPVANAMASAANERALRGSAVVATGSDGRFELAGVQPGRNRIDIWGGDLPDFESDCGEVAAGATLDIGTITLPRGGTAIVRARGELLAAAELRVWSADARRAWDVGEQAGRLCSKCLAPGDYYLAVEGDSVAAQAVPFAIRAGEETIVDVTVTAGTTQPLAIALPPGGSDGWVAVVVRREDGEVAARSSIQAARDGSPAEVKPCLAPGIYTASVQLGERQLRATFTVGAAPAPPIRLDLR